MMLWNNMERVMAGCECWLEMIYLFAAGFTGGRRSGGASYQESW